MFTRIRNLHPLGLVAVGVVATLVLSGTAIAVTDATFTYSTTQTGYLTIHPMDLAPGGSSHADGYTTDPSGGILATSTGGCFNTGVNVPQLAKVTTVLAYYVGLSNSPTGVYLVREKLVDGDGETIAGQSLTDTGGVRKSLTITVPVDRRTVRNNVYSYGFGICLDAGEAFHGARITYTYTTAGD